MNLSDILIVNLEKYNDLRNSVVSELSKLNINYYIPGTTNINTTIGNEKPDKFWDNDAITISKIERAKGNEAVMVYVIGLDHIAKNEESIIERNKLFTAMTRAKCFLKLMAVADKEYTLYEEIKQSIEANGKFEFNFTKPQNTADDSES